MFQDICNTAFFNTNLLDMILAALSWAMIALVVGPPSYHDWNWPDLSRLTALRRHDKQRPAAAC